MLHRPLYSSTSERISFIKACSVETTIPPCSLHPPAYLPTRAVGHLQPLPLPSPMHALIHCISVTTEMLSSSCCCRKTSERPHCHMLPNTSEQMNDCSLARSFLVWSNWPHLSVPYGKNAASNEVLAACTLIFPLYVSMGATVQLVLLCYFYVAVQRLHTHIWAFTLHFWCPHSPMAQCRRELSGQMTTWSILEGSYQSSFGIQKGHHAHLLPGPNHIKQGWDEQDMGRAALVC